MSDCCAVFGLLDVAIVVASPNAASGAVDGAIVSSQILPQELFKIPLFSAI